MKLKPEEYQQYGEPLRATHVYDIAFSLPVFVKSKLKVSAPNILNVLDVDIVDANRILSLESSRTPRSF